MKNTNEPEQWIFVKRKLNDIGNILAEILPHMDRERIMERLDTMSKAIEKQLAKPKPKQNKPPKIEWGFAFSTADKQ